MRDTAGTKGPTERGLRRPGPQLLLTEAARSSLEFGALGAMLPLLRRASRGDGHGVLVFPGFMASDNSTRTLRWYLRDLGYHAHGWRLGVNIGPTDRILDGMSTRIESLHEYHEGPVSLIGWSLGGVYAREMARQYPDAVRQVITLGSPFAIEDRETSNAGPLYNMLATFHSPRVDSLREPELERIPVPVPTTAIYTKGDGIVPWRACVDDPSARPDVENVRVIGSHCGLGHNPRALAVIADRLAQPAGGWKPYRRRVAVTRS
jgi:pimeloyl-ACP methyl ester carboxylesterase